MSELKCPFCQQELQEDIGYDGDYYCPNCRGYYFGSSELWEELIRTRKALEIAVDALFDIHKHSYACCNPASEIGYIHAVSYNALEKTCKEFERINQKEEK